MQAAGAFVGATIGLGVQIGWDIYQGQLSSGSTYAGAVVGGAAGGAAATLCGAACAGAVASATSNLVRNGINGTVDPVGFVAETAAGGLTGGALGWTAPKIFTALPPSYSGIKGDIGEGLSALGLRLTGQSFETRVPNSVPRSSFDFGLADGSFVESKFGTGQLSSAQNRAIAAGDQVDVHYWTYPTVSGIGAAGAAAGTSGK